MAAIISPPQIRHIHHSITSSPVNTETMVAAAAFPAAAAAMVGCGWRIGQRRRGGAYKTSDLLPIFPCMVATSSVKTIFKLVVDFGPFFGPLGAIRRQTTIVVAVRRWYSHHSRTMWCRAVAAQPLGMPLCAQPFDATTVAATEPAVATTATTAAPWWCWACGGDPPVC
nr:hypothetical protein [Tanacetum cinerariifolium]